MRLIVIVLGVKLGSVWEFCLSLVAGFDAGSFVSGRR